LSLLHYLNADTKFGTFVSFWEEDSIGWSIVKADLSFELFRAETFLFIKLSAVEDITTHSYLKIVAIIWEVRWMKKTG